MRENRTYGSEGGAAEPNRPSLPLSNATGKNARPTNATVDFGLSSEHTRVDFREDDWIAIVGRPGDVEVGLRRAPHRESLVALRAHARQVVARAGPPAIEIEGLESEPAGIGLFLAGPLEPTGEGLVFAVVD